MKYDLKALAMTMLEQIISTTKEHFKFKLDDAELERICKQGLGLIKRSKANLQFTIKAEQKIFEHETLYCPSCSSSFQAQLKLRYGYISISIISTPDHCPVCNYPDNQSIILN